MNCNHCGNHNSVDLDNIIYDIPFFCSHCGDENEVEGKAALKLLATELHELKEKLAKDEKS